MWLPTCPTGDKASGTEDRAHSGEGLKCTDLAEGHTTPNPFSVGLGWPLERTCLPSWLFWLLRSPHLCPRPRSL